MRFRTATEVATAAPDAAAAITQALALTSGHGQTTLLLALAARSDLTDSDVQLLLGSPVGIRTMSVALALNPATRDHPDLTFGLYEARTLARNAPDALAERILTILSDATRVYPEADAIIRSTAELLGLDRISTVFDAWIRERRFIEAADHPLLPVTHQPVLTEALTTHPDDDVRYDLAEALAQRTDLTEATGAALYAYVSGYRPPAPDGATRTRDALLNHLAGNPHLPAPTLKRLATHRKQWVRNVVLSRDSLPLDVVWHAARAGHTNALAGPAAKNATTAPDDIIEITLTLIESGPDEAHLIALLMRTRATDEALYTRLLDHYTATRDGLLFADAVLCLSNALRIAQPLDPGPATDALNKALAAHPNPLARTLAIDALLTVEDLATAVADPDPRVRLRTITHPLMTGDLLASLVDDPDPSVAQAAGNRFLTALEPLT